MSELKICEHCGLKYININHTCPELKENIREEENRLKSKSILLEAEVIVNGDRNVQYGDPKDAFKIYSEILSRTFNIELSPIEICKVQMAIKLGRLRYQHKRDSLVDLCGYAEILNRLEEK